MNVTHLYWLADELSAISVLMTLVLWLKHNQDLYSKLEKISWSYGMKIITEEKAECDNSCKEQTNQYKNKRKNDRRNEYF